MAKKSKKRWQLPLWLEVVVGVSGAGAIAALLMALTLRGVA